MNSSQVRDPRFWEKWKQSGSVQSFAFGHATDGPCPPPCNPEIFAKGEQVFLTNSIPSNAMEGWVRKVAKESGQPVDWHFAGGHARVLALGDLKKVGAAIAKLKSEHDRLQREGRERISAQFDRRVA